MTFEQIWPWLASFTNLEKIPSATARTWRLDRMDALLEVFGHPERGRPTFHLAGSKGKGSTAAFIASILAEAGFHTGLYTSPHLTDWRERITLNGTPFSKEAYVQAIEPIVSFWNNSTSPERRGFETTWGGPPTTFELLTLCAWILFRQQGCDIQVLETGLGGRLDATNVCQPDFCVLTLIEYEHTEILGTTLQQIATEKAGILKAGISALVTPQSEEALKTFIDKAQTVGAPLLLWENEVKTVQTQSRIHGNEVHVQLQDGTVWNATLPVLGQHQAENALTAALAVLSWASQTGTKTLNGLTWNQAIENGWARVRLLGRMEVLNTTPMIVIDGAHTVRSAEAAAKTWRELVGPTGTLLFGAFDGKDLEGMARVLLGSFDRVLLCPPGDERANSPARMAEAFTKAGLSEKQIQVFGDTFEAWRYAISLDQPTLVLGSFYLAGKVRNWGLSGSQP